MAKNVVTIHIQKRHGVLDVQAYGRGPKGQKYYIETVPLKAKGPDDPLFKDELSSAVDEILG